MDFVIDIVEATKIDTGAIAIIAPYQSKVNYMNRVRMTPPRYSPLSSMRQATTVDYSQVPSWGRTAGRGPASPETHTGSMP